MAQGSLFFVRMQIPNGEVKDVWVNEGMIQVKSVSTSLVMTIPEGTFYCPTMDLAMQHPLVHAQNAQEEATRDKLQRAGCGVIEKNFTSNK